MSARSLTIGFLLITFVGVHAQTISGTLTQNTTLTAGTPWKVTGDLTIPNGVTLKIEAGTTLHFAKDAHLYIENGGRLVADGRPEQRIVMTSESSSARWRGLRFNSTLADNLLRCVDFINGDASQYVILIDHSKVIVDGCTWTPTNKTIIEVNHPSALIENCIFPTVTEVELIHGVSLTGSEYLIVRGNTFHSTTGYNDIIDFTGCKRPGPILQIYDNLFLGGGDDALDLDGTDCHIEGNVFTNFHKGHTGSSTSNAIATGVNNGSTSDIVVVRNLFYDNDHAILIKEGCFLRAENNTFVKHPLGVVNFSEWPDRNVPPGKGAVFERNIFWDYDKPFENQISQPGNPDPVIVVNRCLITSAVHHLGVGNIDADPQFVDPPNDFNLLAASPAKNHSTYGLDLGAYVPAGVALLDGPPDSTTQQSALFSVGGPGIVSYQYAINDPDDPYAWSKERPIDLYPTISLANLPPGHTYSLYVRGKNSAGVWQSDPPYISRSWKVTFPAGVSAADERIPALCGIEAYPNPFNERTRIRFTLVRRQKIEAAVFDVLGRKLKTLALGEYNTGHHELIFAADELSSGIYFVRIVGPQARGEKRLFLVR
ncbi:MAG: T9SS type A sorting domain-containing protein [candidate division KSB1 bacterium]|nr:T9SS type A sorting domain-containing protein [candidate division KSB1 bacterium]MDZ7346575.1 T9SS type A sorting domain-containing protein [candidate division KSB1 bacterium]